MAQTALQTTPQAEAETPGYVADCCVPVTRWHDQTGTIRIFIVDGSLVKNWHPDNRQLVRRAMADWQAVLGDRLQLVEADNAWQADVVLDWLAHIYGTKDHPVDEQTAGINLRETMGDTVTRNDIRIALFDHTNQPIPSEQLYGIVLHELGHMLGITGHSRNPQDVMYPTSMATALSEGDKATMRALYDQPPKVSNPYGLTQAQMRQALPQLTEANEASKRKDHATAYSLFMQLHTQYPADPFLAIQAATNAIQVERGLEAVDLLKPFLGGVSLSQSQSQSQYQAMAQEMTGHGLIQMGMNAHNNGHKRMARQAWAEADGYLSQALSHPQLDRSRVGPINEAKRWIGKATRKSRLSGLPIPLPLFPLTLLF
ncbi:MAG: matrixin family metalloprotease [Cyanobacteria bacterium HKST-UBA04]|nr:matrixin family metalloprotease [Cyanobacteria bacterium HKST-UBA04]